jgi:hypothetical protein
MTLLVAGSTSTAIWMVADAVVSEGDLGTREREYALKIVPSRDRRALVGFSGDLASGTKLAHASAAMPGEKKTADFLLAEHHEHPSVDFAYAYRDQEGLHLIRIARGVYPKK